MGRKNSRAAPTLFFPSSHCDIPDLTPKMDAPISPKDADGLLPPELLSTLALMGDGFGEEDEFFSMCAARRRVTRDCCDCVTFGIRRLGDELLGIQRGDGMCDPLWPVSTASSAAAAPMPLTPTMLISDAADSSVHAGAPASVALPTTVGSGASEAAAAAMAGAEVGCSASATLAPSTLPAPQPQPGLAAPSGAATVAADAPAPAVSVVSPFVELVPTHVGFGAAASSADGLTRLQPRKVTSQRIVDASVQAD